MRIIRSQFKGQAVIRGWKTLLLAAWLTVAATSFGAETANSWIKSTSGAWDDPSSWSLGMLPDSSQSVQITNSGWKAVAINPSTPTTFPDSMTVSDLTIRGDTNTENVLLLNYFGTAVPLTVLNGLTLQDDGRLLNFNSGLVVQGGTITVTNTRMIQDGGFVRTTNATFYLQRAEYDLTNGIFEGGTVYLGLPLSASFNQYGGSVMITNLAYGRALYPGAGGTYALYAGELSLPNGLSLLSDGNSSAGYSQAGGTNRTPRVDVEDGFITISLSGGLLADNDVNVMAGYYGTATIEQNGGTHIITNSLSIAGGAHSGTTVHPATYRLNDGTLSVRHMELGADDGDSVFVQSNGTATAETIYTHSEGYYASHNTIVTLAGGTLSCSNYTNVDGGGQLNQSGGALIISNLLDFGGFRNAGLLYPLYGRYTFTGGTVTASNINMTGDWVIGDSTVASRISNGGFFSLSHLLQIGNAVEQLGRFILASNATINLAGNASRLSFANSSGEAWVAGATLVVANWNGNPSGGGAEQLKFGTSQFGLTPAQLSQIQFSVGGHFYSAKILSTGEVVPDSLISPTLTYSKQGNNLVLTWPSGWTLQSAPNVLGPYQDVPGATSPYSAPFNSPRQFFRLRF